MFGSGIVFLCRNKWLNIGKHGQETQSTNVGAESLDENTPNASKNFSPKSLLKLKSSWFLKKKISLGVCSPWAQQKGARFNQRYSTLEIDKTIFRYWVRRSKWFFARNAVVQIFPRCKIVWNKNQKRSFHLRAVLFFGSLMHNPCPKWNAN